MDKIGHISIFVFALNALAQNAKAFKFSIFFHEIFRINIEVNFALNLLLGFLKKLFAKF